MSLTYLYVRPDHWSISSILTRLTQEDPSIDPELNKYPPLLAYGWDVVASAIKLVTTNVTAAATHLGLPVLSNSVTDTLKSLTVTKYVDFTSSLRH
jgi:hypothetical protein